LKARYHGDHFFIERQQSVHFFSVYSIQTGNGIDKLSNNLILPVFILILLIVTASHSIAQNHISLSDDQKNSLELARAIGIYKSSFNKHYKIYTGKYYSDSYIGIKDHPFYNENTWEIGTIAYDNEEYDSIEIKYDIYKDLLLVKHVDDNGYLKIIQLYTAKVDNFQISGHHFMQFKEDSLPNNINGFYDILYSGAKASVLAKRIKEIDRSTTSTSLEKKFVIKDKLYIRIEEDFHEIKKRKSMFEVFSDHKSELKAYLKLNKSRFRNDHERELVEAVEYYNSVVNMKN